MYRKYDITAILYDKRGRVLSIGKNSYVKTHPLQAQYNSKHSNGLGLFLHAELHAITRCRDLSRAHRMVIMRFSKKGEPRMARPCPVCIEALKDAGIKFVEYTTSESKDKQRERII